MSNQKKQKLMDAVKSVMRLLHYSIHTARAYCEWIKRYIHSQNMPRRDDWLPNAEAKIEAFLTHVAVETHVAASTQNQAMNALVFLYKQVLKQPLDQKIPAIRAAKNMHVPVVLTRQEVAQVLSCIAGTAPLVVKLLSGSGWRIMEAVRVRVQEIDYELTQLTVRSGKGATERLTPFPASLSPLLTNHLKKV